ncbi:MAG: superoxide dismutase [Planctomycetaceae bacterium]|nr:superoxide dismutase [Planctomycetaceae bacterium]
MAASLLVPGGVVNAQESPKPIETPAKKVEPGKHEIVALPFDPAKLAGISEKMIRSHHEKNYTGAVKNLNKVEEQIAATGKDTPGFLVSGLRERELTFTNSIILHEHYFANLGGDGKPAGSVKDAIATAFGSYDRFEEQCRTVGASLGGGSGWTILNLNYHTGDLRLYWSGGHTHALAFGRPLLVMDMFEHAYQMDYGAAATSYIDAFFKNLNWEEVDRRYQRAVKAMNAGK